MPLGNTLARLRRERGKTLAEVEAATKIMGRMLSALENERWDELPAKVYVKGYIQNYADFLGVDAAPLLEEYAHDTGMHAQLPERPHLKHIPEQTVVPHRLDVHAIPTGAWKAIAAAVVVVALLVWGISALVGRDDTPPPIPVGSTPASDSASSVTEVGETGSAATAPASGEPFTLKIDVAEGQSSWLQVTVDSLLAYDGTLPGGQSKQWTVTSDAVIRVGKPAAVTITRDDRPVEIPAATDGIAEVTVTAAAD
ncbi:MAG: helix-turn-helix domain-containing protein [Coriobacteriia bacterium]|nr:helix-turn-helix domain-containing protein [Coriobacteriia bacterium]